MDEVIKVISPPPDTLGNCVAHMALHPPHLSLKGYTIFQDSKHGYQSTPVTRGEVSARLFSNRRVCWSGGWAEELMAPFQRGQTDRQKVKPITRASPPLSPPAPPTQLEVL